jgi:hypothetical protein
MAILEALINLTDLEYFLDFRGLLEARLMAMERAGVRPLFVTHLEVAAVQTVGLALMEE